jgi:FKBP-type peptidyl-prolyl cis-trans isomerase
MAEIPAPPDVAAAPADAEVTASGLASKVIQAGTGSDHPTSTSKVTVHYTGWTTDGKMFDSSVARGTQSSFGLNQVIPGWTEGLQLMVKGEKRRFWIPGKLAYDGQPSRPQGLLVFDVELFDFNVPPPPPAIPSDVEAVPENAVKTESGLATRVLKAGTGTEKPSPESTVSVHLSFWKSDGTLVQSTATEGQPAQFPLQRINAPGLLEGLQMMVVGEKRRLWVPEGMGFPGGGPEGMLVFDLELLEVKNPLPAPADVAAAPEDAEVTKSGLASKVLRAGTGTEHPKGSTRVTVHYTGWTTDGKMFDSSVQRGEPSSFGLNAVIKGWTEGLQLMVKGEKRRFWIPSKLAYGTTPGKPQGVLVFDVELIDF